MKVRPLWTPHQDMSKRCSTTLTAADAINEEHSAYIRQLTERSGTDRLPLKAEQGMQP